MYDNGKMDALSEKEKEALRLLLAGHDAKSSAQQLGLSHHTVNDRLRSARRKLGTGSSREAALLLAQAEGTTPEPVVHKPLGSENETGTDDLPSNAEERAGLSHPQRRKGGLIIMTITIALIAGAAVGLTMNGSTEADAVNTDASAGAAEAAAHPAKEVATSKSLSADTARDFLKRVDAGEAKAAYAMTSENYRQGNGYDLFELGVLMRANAGGAQRRTLVNVEGDADPDTPGASALEILTFDTVMLNGDRNTERVVMGRVGNGWKVLDVDTEDEDDK
ncbi:helix-turn-helix transcriptional regulator [Sphingomicrobium flavum]|uniref:helix-turn-helix transcriptional regulator n=1 Tax=Sphingomicrobium flavum TaxID=1229164 RepID=UPI0021ADDD17|nr:helix-turn-helix transcriptional regulator [Sphingomicrobium flavum]